jgi:hypothetical protein
VNGEPFPVGDGWYVLGDQLRDSVDSHYEGSVSRARIVGPPWLQIWPPPPASCARGGSLELERWIGDILYGSQRVD